MTPRIDNNLDLIRALWTIRDEAQNLKIKYEKLGGFETAINEVEVIIKGLEELSGY